MRTERQRLLRFEIDPDEITLGRLIRIEGIVSRLIREVTADALGPDAVTWVVDSVSSGSPIVYALRPRAKHEGIAAEAVAVAVPAISQGIRSLDRHSIRPPYFTDEALERARDLARELGKDVRAVRFYVDDGEPPATITPRLAANAEAVLHEESYESLGTVEGRLETLSIHDKQYFNVYDDLSGNKVECLFADSGIQPSEVGAAIGSRVAVFGLLTSRESGRVVRIRVRELEVFPTPEHLPSADDIGGIVA